MNYKIYIFFALLSTALFVACSTEKNTLINRTYHSTTAHYNGYFNANDLINQALKTYESSLKEDFDELLPVFPLPNETEVLGLYPAIDTAIAKCTKVITNHSMPSAENPSNKKEEHNRWIDENWTTIGQANFYRRDYDDALKSLEYVRKFYGKDPSNYIASLWIAKTQIQLKEYSKATLTLEKLAKAAKEYDEKIAAKKKVNLFKKDETTESGKKKKKPSRKAKKRAKKKAKKEEEENKTVDFPKSIRFDLEKTQASLAIKKGETDDAIEFLEKALTFAKKKQDKARVHFILGQLYGKKGSNQEAKSHFTKVIKYSNRFEMTFNARIKRAFMGGDAKIKKEFEKMLRDSKNAEYKDQIYFALAEIAFQEGKKEKGIEYLHKSALYSISNAKQKGKSYEKLGDLSYADRDYIRAQKYYDSCAKVIPENYPNGEVVRNKAEKLKDLVEAVEIASYEDSVQRIAAMSPAEQEAFAEKLIKKIKEDEAQRKRMEEVRKAEIQSQQALFNQNTSGNKWYWNNARTRSDGFDEFRKTWGSRDNEDNWRRSDKIVAATQLELDENGKEIEVIPTEATKDELTVENLLKDLPQGDSAIAASNARLVNALYDAGIIYKDQLNELEMAGKQFDAILARNYESDFNLLASFQLYKLNESSNRPKAEAQKDYILTYYPNSDYANYLRDPNFFVKRKEIEKLAEGEYVRVLDRYNRGLYYPVLTKANQVIDEEPKNPFRSKFMLLKALSLGQLNTDKSGLVPVLEQLSAEYPNSPEDSVGKEMLAVIKNGYSKDIEANFNKASIYKYEDNKEHWVIIFLDEKQSSSIAKTQVSDFNKEFFGKEKLNTSSKIFGDNQSVITVKTMTEMEAVRYMRIFKETRKYLLDLNKAKIISISQDNMKILFETKKLAEYELFYLEKY